MDNLDYIETYFTGETDPVRKAAFEERIQQDPEFAKEVAFYLSVVAVNREISETGKKRRFKEIYLENRDAGSRPDNLSAGPSPVAKIPTPFRTFIPYIAAAAVIAGIILGTYFFSGQPTPQQLALQYEKEHLQKLGVTMSGRSDSIQTGLGLYNEGKTSEALLHFENIIASDTSNFTAKEYAGLSALQLKDYDKALMYFEQLETYNSLYANPALIYKAVTLMERNQSGDPAKAKEILRIIVNKDLEGAEQAQEWLKKW